MYYGRKKGIIIAIIVVVVLILVALGGVLVVLNTDLFKSNETLFWKYMANSAESMNVPENTQMLDIEKMKQQSPYKVTGELTATSDNEDISATLEKIKLNVNGESDITNNYSHMKAEAQYANTNMLDLDYVHDDEIYGVKSDEIVTVYLGVKNDNLDVLLQKLGINVSVDIPEGMNASTLLDTFNFSDEEIKHIQETYLNVIQENITKENYSKQTEAVISKDGISYNTTSYRLDLTGEQITQIATQMLNTLKTDSITLNLIATKGKALGASDEYTTIDGITKKIDEAITKIQTKTYEDCSIVVYAYKGETIATEILIKNETKVTIYTGTETMQINIENLKANADYSTMYIKLTNKITSTQTNIGVTVNVDGKTEVAFNMLNTGSAAQKTLDTAIDFAVTTDGEKTEVNYTQNIEFVSELEDKITLDETNCAVLNDYTTEELNTLVNAIVNQTTTVLTQKAMILGLFGDMQNTDNTIQDTTTE